jgi:chromosome segregation ATPase
MLQRSRFAPRDAEDDAVRLRKERDGARAELKSVRTSETSLRVQLSLCQASEESLRAQLEACVSDETIWAVADNKLLRAELRDLKRTINQKDKVIDELTAEKAALQEAIEKALK